VAVVPKMRKHALLSSSSSLPLYRCHLLASCYDHAPSPEAGLFLDSLLCPSEDVKDVCEPFDKADAWLIVRGVKDEKGWVRSCCSCCCVTLLLAVGTPTVDRKGGSWYGGPRVL
jgi:hypothetical protein